jgi:hypothetical protein
MQEPYVALLSGMMLKRDECTANDKTGTGQHYTDGWGRWRGKQHKRIVGTVNIMCMARRAARRVASGMVTQASGVRVMGTAALTMAMGAAAGGTTHAGGDRGTGTEAQRVVVDTTVVGTELSWDR